MKMTDYILKDFFFIKNILDASLFFEYLDAPSSPLFVFQPTPNKT